MSESRICIALDFQTKDEVKAFLDKSEDEKLYVKIGMELFYGEGIEMIKMIKEKGLNVDIEVDGGITKQNVSTVLEAGANVIVAGSAVFHGDIGQNVRDMMAVLNAAETGKPAEI